MRRVIVHIDSLVLKGFRHEDRHAIAEGLGAEMGRLLADPQAAKQLTARGDVSRLRIGNVHIGAGEPPQRVGTQLARGLGRGMKT